MLIYTFWSFFMLSILSFLVAILFYGLLVLGIYFLVYGWLAWRGKLEPPLATSPQLRVLRFQRKQASYERPGELEEVQE